MEQGKEKCRILKAIRAYVAEKYGLEYTASECTHQGDCPGTCPKCDAELASLQQQLDAKGITDIAQDEVLSKLLEAYRDSMMLEKESPSADLRFESCTQGKIEFDNKHVEVLEGDPASFDSLAPMPQFQRRVILECPVAGITFHDIHEIWDELYVGARIALVRERDNKYDSNAVAVALADDYDGDPDDFDFDYILGYIPRDSNQMIAAMLDMGWQDQIEAEISGMKSYGPYADRLHITAYIRSKEPIEPKDDRLRVKLFDDNEEWQNFQAGLWANGVFFFRWGGCSGWKSDWPERGDKVVFLRKSETKSIMYLMMVIAVGDDCKPFVESSGSLQLDDDREAYVLSVIQGPMVIQNEKLAFLDELPTGALQPDFRLERGASDALMELVRTTPPTSVA